MPDRIRKWLCRHDAVGIGLVQCSVCSLQLSLQRQAGRGCIQLDQFARNCHSMCLRPLCKSFLHQPHSSLCEAFRQPVTIQST